MLAVVGGGDAGWGGGPAAAGRMVAQTQTHRKHEGKFDPLVASFPQE